VDHNSDLPSAADFTRLEGELFERIALRHRRRVLRHRVVVAGAVLVLASAGIAAGTISNPTQQSRLAYCYGGSTTSSRATQLVINDSAKPGSTTAGITRARVANALTTCEAAWRGGVFSTSTTSPFAVPTLQVCVRNDLALAVLRKDNTTESADAFCNRLGLSAP
jgi:hypothetical protein